MELKTNLISQISKLLHQKIEAAQSAIAAAKEARNNDTKSSAGDKYETGREMMQIEIDKHELQLSKAEQLKLDLEKIDTAIENSSVCFGALVRTNFETYLISIGLGKFNFDNQTYYAISLASPIGNALKDKSVGDKISFQGREIEILNIS